MDVLIRFKGVEDLVHLTSEVEWRAKSAVVLASCTAFVDWVPPKNEALVPTCLFCVADATNREEAYDYLAGAPSWW